ncbi:sensor histidine kinase [Nocardioides panacisoli]|uniref:histidine kinase n=1 Tax=Nocardioides panacisoli TaxID=627624 RepID=A0ABP7I4U0_9ACTN
METRRPVTLAERLAVTGYAGLHLLLWVPLLTGFILLVTSGVLVVVWVGVVLLLALIPATRALANAHRKLAARILDAPVPPPYRPTSGGALTRLRMQAADPMTWRDLLWTLWALTFGFAISLIGVLLLALVVTIPIWWYGVVPLLQARASVDRALLTFGRTEALEQRVSVLSETRAEVVDYSAAEVRRIERDLHDGPQARLAALSLSLGLADDLFQSDPDAARKLVNEARGSASSALVELRDVVRGIHPPVLADRGLVGAVQALAIDMATPVEVDADLRGRPAAAVESAMYFAIAECLANTAKHSGATRVWIRIRHDGGVLRTWVGDDGRGGTDPTTGTGLRGVATRLAALDGGLRITSPVGGPTTVHLEVPCALS